MAERENQEALSHDSLIMPQNSRFHLTNMRLIIARRQYIEAAIARLRQELDAEYKNLRSQRAIEMTQEPESETLRNEIHDRYHARTITAQYDAVFMPRLVAAAFLEVDNVEDAEYLVYLREFEGWGGVACLNDDFIPIKALGSIVQALEAGLVPIRYFHRDEVGNPVFE